MTVYRGKSLAKVEKDWKSLLTPSLLLLDAAWKRKSSTSLILLGGIAAIIAMFKKVMDADIDSVAEPSVTATSDITKLTHDSKPVESTPKPTLAQRAKSFVTQRPIAEQPTTEAKLQSFDYSSDVKTAILEASKATGVDSSLLAAFIHIESKGDPKARSGSFVGLGQLGEPAWQDISKRINLPPITKAYDPRLDAKLNALATATLIQINSEYLTKNGITPTISLLYTAHNLGPSRAVKIAKGEFDKGTVEAISGKMVKGKLKGGQAAELKAGGHTQYLANVEASLAKRMPSVASAPSLVSPMATSAPKPTSPMAAATSVESTKPAPTSASSNAAKPFTPPPAKVAKVAPSPPGIEQTYKPASTETKTTEYVRSKSGALIVVPT